MATLNQIKLLEAVGEAMFEATFNNMVQNGFDRAGDTIAGLSFRVSENSVIMQMPERAKSINEGIKPNSITSFVTPPAKIGDLMKWIIRKNIETDSINKLAFMVWNKIKRLGVGEKPFIAPTQDEIDQSVKIDSEVDNYFEEIFALLDDEINELLVF